MTKKAKRGTPRRAKRRPAKRKASTALVRRVDQVQVLEPAPPARVITEGMALGELGLDEITFTEAEEKILAEPVDGTKVLIKPDGAPYLPHAEYTRWLNRAIGRGCWSLVPVGVPAMANKTVVCPYVLFIHRQPAAFAQGEQEYFEGNRNQSYGDALESTVASALRRCMKHLGVGLELWDKSWLEQWKASHAVRVWVTDRGERKLRWRRVNDPRLPYEQGPASIDDHEPPRAGGERSSSSRSAPAAGEPRKEYQHTHAASGEPITDKQRQRLAVIIRNSGRDPQEVDRWLNRRFGYTDHRQIKRSEYDLVWQAVEADADLPEGPRR